MAYKEIWEIGNIAPEDVEDWATTCRLDGGITRKAQEPGGNITLTCLLKEEKHSSSVVPTPVPPAATVGNAVRIQISADDVTALTTVAQSEVGHFEKYGESVFRGALAAVVDTVINRVAHNKHPDTINGVVDFKWAFTAIHKAGGWQNWKSANGLSAMIEDIVREHLSDRSGGMASELQGATHFLNPHYSSENALAQWGNYVVKNHVRSYGHKKKKDVHFHGFPPGGTLPNSYVLAFEGREVLFRGNGTAQGGSPSRSEFAEEVVRLCRRELAFFEDGKRKETEDPHFKRVGEYWELLDLPYDGLRTDQPWSAAFVSWIMSNAGAGDKFPYRQAHCHYFQHFNGSIPGQLYRALPPKSPDAIPEPGDVVHFGREYAKSFDFETAADKYAGDTFYPSHSDLIVSVDLAGNAATTIGGNLSDSVREDRIKLTSAGLLSDRTEIGKKFPYIGLLKLIR
ncbi:MAG: DUF2272 domain-containing protein [Pseudomonadota bacterium]